MRLDLDPRANVKRKQDHRDGVKHRVLSASACQLGSKSGSLRQTPQTGLSALRVPWPSALIFDFAGSPLSSGDLVDMFFERRVVMMDSLLDCGRHRWGSA